MLKQISRDVRNVYEDTAGIDMKYEVFEEFCRGAWIDEPYKYLLIDRLESRSESKYCICHKKRLEMYIERIADTKPHKVNE